MKIKVVPRKFFLDIKGTDCEDLIFGNWNVISICTPEHIPTRFEEEDIPFSEKYRKDALVLYFHDLDHSIYSGDVLFNEDMAKQIYDFVNENKSNEKGFLVHCTAGISRSQAVGLVLNEFLNKIQNADYKDYIEYEELYSRCRRPNALVKKLLWKEFEKHLEIQDI